MKGFTEAPFLALQGQPAWRDSRGREFGYNSAVVGHSYPAMLPRHRLPVLGTFTVGFLLLYLVVLAPHLVHHIGDGNAGRPPCPHLVQSQQAQVVQMDPPTLAPPEPVETLKVTPPEIVIPPSPGAPCASRAPPRPPASACS